VCTLAHVFELAGLATIVLTPMRDVAERIKVPRALYTAFPLGLSLGKPGDKEFQHKVLKWSFSLLDEPKGPVVKAFPDQINVAEGNQITCPLPPRMNLNLHPAADEAEALYAAYTRAYTKKNRTSMGMQICAEQVPEALQKFAKIVDGVHWAEVGFPNDSLGGSMYGTVHDIRSYYEELACELADGPISPWATEEWFYDQTKAGQLILEARKVMKENGADQSLWFGLATAGR